MIEDGQLELWVSRSVDEQSDVNEIQSKRHVVRLIVEPTSSYNFLHFPPSRGHHPESDASQQMQVHPRQIFTCPLDQVLEHALVLLISSLKLVWSTQIKLVSLNLS